MRIFLDTSVLLSACHSETGASRYICDHSITAGWQLLVSPYLVVEATRNLIEAQAETRKYWSKVRGKLAMVPDVLSISNPVIFSAAKDKPILFSAFASADTLLTLDSKDFGSLLGTNFYHLRVFKPADFLIEQRRLGAI